MKIAIVGGGISGLSTYLNFKKQLAKYQKLEQTIDIKIYEPHELPTLGSKRAEDIPSTGGGYGLAANGMASLRRLDPSLHKQIFEAGFPTAKTVMKSARGWTLGVMPFNDLRGEHPECCVMVLREVVIAALYDRIPPSAVIRQKVVKVEDGEEQANLYLDNGESHSYDLVIGADGVWSKARLAILGDKVVPEYRGLFSVGGWITTDHLPPPAETGEAAHGQTVMTFGPNGFFAYTPYTTGNIPATHKHIRGEERLPAGKSAFWWSRAAQTDPTTDLDSAKIKTDLVDRFRSWKDPAILEIIQNSEVALKTPTYVLPKILTWAGKRVVLVGDAAHALPSSSGQGVSQCLEDAEAFSILFTTNLANTTDISQHCNIIEKTFGQYMAVRKAHVEQVLDDGNRAGDKAREMGIVAEYAMYGFMWAMFKLFGTFFLKTVLEYNLHAEIDKAQQQS